MKSRKEITTNSYNKTAEEYRRVVSEFNLLPELFEYEDLIKKKGKILDLGCGPGHHSKYFCDMGHEVVGIDLSQRMIELARKTAPKASFEVMDISDLSFPPKTFEGVWASASLLHIPKLEIRAVLKNLYRILKAGGIFYISLKKGNSEEFLEDDRYDGVEKFYAYYMPIEIETILIEQGFSILKKRIRGKRPSYDTNSWIHIFCIKN
ncbi:class I SAM-dependent methyltransferase [Sphingobacterium sp.]|uniref:class I SAM-dependent methyltransferase n=1 Tax=Sphingobacterium sp. TaxID=341027 RepID=UPI00289B62F9|nr:class I SAM-dependent methyltransferase [Sphingobacterium sp.]